MPTGDTAGYEFDPVRLRQLREAAQLSQAELGAAIGTDDTTIAKYETGVRIPNAQRAVRLAGAVNATPEDLLGQPVTLAQLRITKGLLQRDAASAAGLVRTRYSMLERGEVATLQPDIAERLAAVLGVTVDEIRTAHAQSRARYVQRQR